LVYWVRVTPEPNTTKAAAAAFAAACHGRPAELAGGEGGPAGGGPGHRRRGRQAGEREREIEIERERGRET